MNTTVQNMYDLNTGERIIWVVSYDTRSCRWGCRRDNVLLCTTETRQLAENYMYGDIGDMSRTRNISSIPPRDLNIIKPSKDMPEGYGQW